jgi:hypothetical protein
VFKEDDLTEVEEEGLLELDGFISDDGKHQVTWQLAEIVPNEEYEAWWCVTHNRLYYGGCTSLNE